MLISAFLGISLVGCSSESTGGTYKAGTYTGTAAGRNGDVTVEVVLTSDKIESVTVTDQQETEAIASEALTKVPQEIVDSQSLDVDTVTGATITSNAIIDATEAALTSAGVDTDSLKSSASASADASDDADAEVSFTPGTYEASAMGMNGTIDLSVTFSQDSIDSIQVISSEETNGVGTKAMEILTNHIIQDQSLGEDMVTAATYSSIGFMNAVKDCVEQAGGNTAALAARPVSYDDYSDDPHEAQVIVVGGGVAGMMTALSCKQNGLSVILLERKEFLGGNGLTATGTYLLGDTTVQQAQGIEDSPELFHQWFMDTIPNADSDLAWMIANHSQDLVDWYESNGLSFDYDYMKATTNSDIPRGHQILPTGADSIAIMVQALEDNDVDVRYLTTATELITDDSGKVTGVKATDCNGNETEYDGDYIVIATGGFGDSPDMLVKYWGEQYSTLKFGGIKGSKAEMMQDAISLGADTVDMEVTHIDATLEYTHEIMADTNIITSCGGIIVRTSDGKRIADETYNHGDAISAAEAEVGDEYYYMIFDDKALNFSDAVTQKVNTYIASGLATPYDSVEAMAEGLGIDEASLQATIDEYNAAARGEQPDEFNTETFAGELKPTFYVMKVCNGVVMTGGGLKVNDHSQVLKADGTAIDGLYAAGEITGGLMHMYVAGASLAECSIAGMMIGRQLSGNAD
ncbi:MAG: FAD-dependent oxidoreductase [Bulleidia sp.]